MKVSPITIRLRQKMKLGHAFLTKVACCPAVFSMPLCVLMRAILVTVCLFSDFTVNVEVYTSYRYFTFSHVQGENILNFDQYNYYYSVIILLIMQGSNMNDYPSCPYCLCLLALHIYADAHLLPTVPGSVLCLSITQSTRTRQAN